ncbi:RNA-directed DNA polymerase, eukaryota [Tanacetum coccineum]|uniref:RNA-directed DNA polymerase, eukaryota n=1 Tax=Tanacetum coccineum TaxID=301880 RepID=A0ABQ5J341_9ASTR
MKPYEEGEIYKEANEHVKSQPHKDSNPSNKDEKDKEDNITNSKAEPAWADEVYKMQREEEKQNTIFENQSNSHYSAHHENGGIFATSSPIQTTCSDGEKLSWLDRDLISDNLAITFPNMHATTMDRMILDHQAIILQHSDMDSTPIPFKLFNSWLQAPDFGDVIKNAWDNFQCKDNSNMHIMLKEKMKHLKNIIKVWAKNSKAYKGTEKHIMLQSIAHVETILEAEGCYQEVRKDRQVSLTKLHQLETEDRTFLTKFYSLQVLAKLGDLGFGGCLSSSKASILVNGSPTIKDNLQQGLRQGDPIFPFLFILVMEGLHVEIHDAINAGLYCGARLHYLHVSHLPFADDVLLLGEWSSMSIFNVVNLLNCFYKVLGLKHNLHKSNLYGVGLDLTKVSNLALVTVSKLNVFLSPTWVYRSDLTWKG